MRTHPLWWSDFYTKETSTQRHRVQPCVSVTMESTPLNQHSPALSRMPRTLYWATTVTTSFPEVCAGVWGCWPFLVISPDRPLHLHHYCTPIRLILIILTIMIKSLNKIYPRRGHWYLLTNTQVHRRWSINAMGTSTFYFGCRRSISWHRLPSLPISWSRPNLLLNGNSGMFSGKKMVFVELFWTFQNCLA